MMTLLHVTSGVIASLSGSDGIPHGSAGRVGGSRVSWEGHETPYGMHRFQKRH